MQQAEVVQLLQQNVAVLAPCNNRVNSERGCCEGGSASYFKGTGTG